ncbi:ankyrin repeat domain-containing protein 50-like [Aplysia californica]|uniref:Ankyrin repeat domain-containing protein 50-like n=1 Tax=Aplysia californica TaxID=6500 RepID=A0ABM0ZZR6_APLCA|nr:ankyrin repeat domain-containing protein 50-like [Aplysia californica]
MGKQSFQGAPSQCQKKDDHIPPGRRSMRTASKASSQNAQSHTGGEDTLGASVRVGRRSLQGTVSSSKCYKKGQKPTTQNTRNGGHRSSLASTRKRKKSCRSSDSETPAKRQRKSKCDKTVESVSSCTSSQDKPSHSCQKKNQRSNPNSSSWFTKLSQSLLKAVEAGRSIKVTEILKSHGKCLLSVLDVALLKAVSRGHLFMVQNLIHHGASLHTEIFGKTCFHTAAENGHIDIMEFLLEKSDGRHFFMNDARDRGGNTALILCQGTPSAAHITKILLPHSNEPAINVQNRKGETALMKAVQSQNISAVLQLIKAGANVDLKDKKGNTARSLATALGMDGLLEVLAKDTSGQGLTPIMIAVRAQNTDLLELLLLSKQFNVDEKAVETDEIGDVHFTDTALTMIFNSKLDKKEDLLTYYIDWKTCLHSFEQLTVKEQDIVAMLVKDGANIHIGGKYDYYYISPFLMAVELGDGQLLDLLLKNQKWIGNVDSYAKALEVAARNGRCDLIDALTPWVESLEHHFDLKQEWNCTFQDALNNALKVANEECVGKLLKIIKNIDFNKTMTAAVESGCYPVFLRVRNAYPEKFHQFVSRDEGAKWLCAACKNNNSAIVESLLNSGAKATGSDLYYVPLECSKSADITEMLILNGADVNKHHCSYINGHLTNTALEQAVLSNLTEVVKVLMKHGATLHIKTLNLALSRSQCLGEMRKVLLCFDVNLNQTGPGGQSPLSISAFHGDLESVETLIKKGADVNFKGRRYSCPALISAIKGKNVEITRYLLDHGADVNISNSKGETALTMAARTDDGTIVPLLIEKGAWLNVSNSCNNLTALMVAAKYKNFATFQCLVEAGVDLDVRRNGKTFLTRLLLKRSYFVMSRFIVCLVKHGAKVTSGDAMLAVHNCIALGNFHVLSALIHCGGFNPTLFKDIQIEKTPPFCRAKVTLIVDFTGVFSPLCMALLCGHVTVARDMLKASYLTTSDLTLLPIHTKVREFLNKRGFDESVAVLDEMSVSVPSLQQLCFVHVSDMCGSEPGRKETVRQLGLPGRIERSLLFSCNDQLVGGKCCMAENSSETTPAEVDETSDRYIYRGFMY